MTAGLISCESNENLTNNPRKTRTILVRLTTYSRDEPLSRHYRKHDLWSRRGISSTGIPLKNMQSAAVDPRVIPYFSQIELPGVNHPIELIDTGSAVKSRTAALKWGIDCPVIDLFFDHERDAAAFRKRNPMFVKILIKN